MFISCDGANPTQTEEEKQERTPPLSVLRALQPAEGSAEDRSHSESSSLLGSMPVCGVKLSGAYQLLLAKVSQWCEGLFLCFRRILRNGWEPG